MTCLILKTNTSITNNFTIYLEMRYKGKIELYYAVIDPAKSNVFLLQSSSENEWIREGIVKINY